MWWIRFRRHINVYDSHYLSLYLHSEHILMVHFHCLAIVGFWKSEFDSIVMCIQSMQIHYATDAWIMDIYIYIQIMRSDWITTKHDSQGWRLLKYKQPLYLKRMCDDNNVIDKENIDDTLTKHSLTLPTLIYARKGVNRQPFSRPH